MSISNLPGFTADSSEYRSFNNYSASHFVDRSSQMNDSVVASMMRGCTSICKCCENHGTASCCDRCWNSCPE